MAQVPSVLFFTADWHIGDDRPPVTATHAPKQRRMPPFKVMMLMHFHYVVGPFAPEDMRTSPAYTQFVKELLREGLIVRPTNDEREKYPGWAYHTTAKGDVLVKAICAVPLPVERTRWVIPS